MIFRDQIGSSLTDKFQKEERKREKFIECLMLELEPFLGIALSEVVRADIQCTVAQFISVNVSTEEVGERVMKLIYDAVCESFFNDRIFSNTH